MGSSSRSREAGDGGEAGEAGAKVAEATFDIRKAGGGEAGVAGAAIEGASAGGMRVVERPQVVGEGLSCLRAGGGSSNSITVGGRRSCRCYREAVEGQGWLEAGGSGGVGAKAGAQAGGRLVVERQEWPERVSKGRQQEECMWWRDRRGLMRASPVPKQVGGAAIAY